MFPDLKRMILAEYTQYAFFFLIYFFQFFNLSLSASLFLQAISMLVDSHKCTCPNWRKTSDLWTDSLFHLALEGHGTAGPSRDLITAK